MGREHSCPKCGHTGHAMYHWGTDEYECRRCRHDFTPAQEKESKERLSSWLGHSSFFNDKPVFDSSLFIGKHAREEAIALADEAGKIINFISRATGKDIDTCRHNWMMKNSGKAPTLKTDYHSLVNWHNPELGPTAGDVANFISKETGCDFEGAYMKVIMPKVGNIGASNAFHFNSGMF